MGLFKSVIADARPAKSAARSAYAPASLPGQPLSSQNGNHEVKESGPNTSAGVMRNSATSETLSTIGQNFPLKHDLPALSNEQQEPIRDGETDIGINRQNEPASHAFQDHLATGLIPQFGAESSHQAPDINQTMAESAHRTKQPHPDLPVFTLADQDVDNTVPVKTEQRGDQLPDLPQEAVQISDSSKSTASESTASRIGARAVSDGTAEMTIGRDATLNTAVQEITPSVETGKQADFLFQREKVFHTEEKQQPTTSAIHRQFSDRQDGHNPEQGIAQAQSSVTHNRPAKLGDRQPQTKALAQPDRQHRRNDRVQPSSAPNNLWGKSAQQQPIGNVRSIQQTKTTLSAASAELAEDARLRKLSNAMQQEHQDQLSSIEKRARLVEARSTSLIDDQFARHHASEPRSLRKPSFEAPRTAEVKIGQVDVFVEKSSAASSRGNRTTRPSISLASRHYLRRL